MLLDNHSRHPFASLSDSHWIALAYVVWGVALCHAHKMFSDVFGVTQSMANMSDRLGLRFKEVLDELAALLTAFYSQITLRGIPPSQ